jgi:hypothetical protein
MRSFNGNSGALSAQPEFALRSAVVRSISEARAKDKTRDHAVSMSIRVATGELATARCALHRALGPNLDIYTAIIDNRNGCVTLQLELAARRVPDAMAIIMNTVPEAEFGSIRPAAHSSTH